MTPHTNSEAFWLSVVVPAYEEQDSLAHLCTRLDAVLNEMDARYDGRFEVIFVDDGSKDRTWECIQQMNQTYEWARGVRLARNFGHQSALAAGLKLSRGQAVISMDADLQHPPEVLPQLVEAWEAGAPMVLTRRRSSSDLSVFKRSTSRAFYSFFSWLTEIDLKPGSSDFRLLDRSVLEYIFQLQDASLFFRGAVAWLGYEDTAVVEFQAAERYAGKTGYTFKKMWRMASQSMLSFSTRPLKIGLWLGVATSFLSFLELIYILLIYLRGEAVPGWASTLGLLSMLFGVLFVILGVIGLYVANIYSILQDRPHFVISQDTTLTRASLRRTP